MASLTLQTTSLSSWCPSPLPGAHPCPPAPGGQAPSIAALPVLCFPPGSSRGCRVIFNPFRSLAGDFLVSQCQAQPGSTPWGCGAGLGARGTLLPLWFGQGEGEAARGLLHTSATACVSVAPGLSARCHTTGWEEEEEGENGMGRAEKWVRGSTGFGVIFP